MFTLDDSLYVAALVRLPYWCDGMLRNNDVLAFLDLLNSIAISCRIRNLKCNFFLVLITNHGIVW